MVTVGVIAGVVERRLAAGRLRCPAVRGVWLGGGMPVSGSSEVRAGSAGGCAHAGRGAGAAESRMCCCR
jgi:hypothetical protein